MHSIAQLRRALAKAVDELNAPATIASERLYKAKEAEVERLEAQVNEADRKMRARARTVANAGSGGLNTEEQFANLGEQLHAIARHFGGGGTDPRLIRAPQGMNEGNPADGGFPVQADFASTVLERVYDMGEIASRVFSVPISTNANGLKVPGIDETSRADGSRYGGVQSYWVGEGQAPTAARPKFRTVDLDLKKLMALWYVTEELMQDASALTAIAERAFAEEITFKLENAIIRGTGAGQPKGILATGPKVVVAKESGQTAATLKFENITKMWSRLYARSQKSAVWFINQDVFPQLLGLNAAVSTAGGQLVYMPPGGLSEAPYGTLLGRPVISVEYCETLGAEGDVILADLSQYTVIDKGGINQSSSIHVAFTTDETAFKISYRVDGQPNWHQALTPFKGTNTVSPFVTLAVRA